MRYDERREVNKKKIHRLWREEMFLPITMIAGVESLEEGTGELLARHRGRVGKRHGFKAGRRVEFRLRQDIRRAAP